MSGRTVLPTIGLLVRFARVPTLRRLPATVAVLLVAGLLAPAGASAAPAPAAVEPPERVLLVLDSPSVELRSRVADRVVASGARTTRTYDQLPYVAVEATASEQRSLRASPGVRDVVRDERHSATLAESAPLVGAPAAWAEGFDGAGQVVAVLDSGIDKDHPMLSGKIVDEACFAQAGTCPNGTTEQLGPGAAAPCTFDPEICPHGTHIAGIVAGASTTLNGVARGARIAAVQVFTRETSGCPGVLRTCAVAFTSDLLAGLEHVARLSQTMPIAAVNMSLGGGEYTGTCDREQPQLASAISMLRGLGILTTLSSGNNGFTDAVSSPACVSSAVAVGASTRDDQVANYSNTSSRVALVAPGNAIVSAWPNNQQHALSGTSQSAPHVAGAIAVLRQSRPTATAEEIFAALTGAGPLVPDLRTGRSVRRLQVDAALDVLNGTTGSAPAPAPASAPVSARLSGGDRYATAASIFSAAFGCSRGGAERAVLARGDAFADALAGNYLAGAADTGLLLTTTGSVPASTLAALRASGARTVFLLGGPAAISNAVATQLSATPSYSCSGVSGAPLEVVRIMGTDRYATARRTAEFVGPGGVGTADPTGGGALRTAVVANGLGFADALAAGPLSYAGAAAAAAGNQNGFPTLLTGAAALAPEAEAALGSLGIQQVILPGGTAAVGPAVESRLRGLGITVIRLAGADRTATAAAVARFAVGDSPGYPVGLAFDRSAVTLARGDGFADALAGAAYAGDRAVPLLLTTTPDALGTATVGYLRAAAGVTSSVTAFGGSGAVTANALSAALSALSAERV